MRNNRTLARVLFLATASVALLASAACFGDDGDDAEPEGSATTEATAVGTANGTFVPGGESGAFIVTSDAWDVGAEIPSEFTCDGDNSIPPLQFTDIPEGAETLALLVEDPQAAGGTFVHWVAWNLPLSDVAAGQVPSGAVQGANGSGEDAYTGPCPPEGVHTYFFYAYALDDTLDLAAGASAADLRNEIEDHLVAQSEYIGTYQRQ